MILECVEPLLEGDLLVEDLTTVERLGVSVITMLGAREVGV